MCLAVPAKVVEISGVTATVEIEGVRRSANLSIMPDVKIGDYILMHAGFAIQKWSEEDYQEYKMIMDEMRSVQ